MDEENKIEVEEEEIDDRPISEQVDEIAAELLAEAMGLMKKRKNGKPVSKEEEQSLIDRQRLFKFVKATYHDMVKMGRITNTDNANFDKVLIEKIKKRKSTVGDIVRDIPTASTK